MSGAGRGTPRVSPSSDVEPALPGSAGSPVGDILLLPAAPFRYARLGGDEQDLTDTYAAYSFDGGATVSFPQGSQRGFFTVKYTEGAAGGEASLRVLDGAGKPAMYPSTQANTGDTTSTVKLRELEFLLGDSGGFVIVPFRLFNYQLKLEVKEVGIPGTPGTIEIQQVFSDNIPDNSLFNNISV